MWRGKVLITSITKSPINGCFGTAKHWLYLVGRMQLSRSSIHVITSPYTQPDLRNTQYTVSEKWNITTVKAIHLTLWDCPVCHDEMVFYNLFRGSSANHFIQISRPLYWFGYNIMYRAAHVQIFPCKTLIVIPTLFNKLIYWRKN